MDKQIFTVVDKTTGQELRAQFEGDTLAENEIAVTELRTEAMENPYFNFQTRTFYDKQD
jgi:hypothetical protein